MMTEAANGTMLTAPPAIVDSTSGVWSLVLTPTGTQIVHNGTIQPTATSVAMLLYYNHVVYQQNVSGAWASWNGSWVASTDPRVTESPSGTTVTTIGPTIIDSLGESWSLVNSNTTRGVQIAVNGTIDTTTGLVTLLYYTNHRIYQENSAGGWWYKSKASDTWTTTTDPRASSVAITGLTLSSSSFTGGAPSGTVVGSIAVVMSGGTWSGTLALSGTNAALFQLVGNNLVTSGVVAAGSYSINLVATQAGATGSPFTKAFSITGAGGSTTVAAPSQAVNAGYHNLVWVDDFTASSSIAPAQYSNSGFKWYWAQRNGKPASPSEWVVNTTATAGSINNGNSGGGPNASSAGGILQINTGGFPNANIITLPGWAMNTNQGTMPPIGTGHWSHCYMEAYIQFKPNQNTAVPYNQTGWPAFWSWAAESIGDYGFGSVNAHAPDATEVDFLESFGYALWSSGTHNPLSTWNGTIINHGTGATAGLASGSIDSNWHTYGFLWVPGQVSMYFDNVQTNSHSLSGFSLDSQSLFLTLGTGPNWQMNVDWVRVWQ